jgi:hypothetical protein
MSGTKKTDVVVPAPPRERAALRETIAERDAKRAEVSRVQKAEARGYELVAGLESELAKFDDLDAKILHHRAKRVRDAAQVASGLPDLRLPSEMSDSRKARDEAVEQVAAAKHALKNLGTDLAQARWAAERAERLVSEAAQAILIEEAIIQATALKVAWSRVWHIYDVLNALPGTKEQLPADALRIMRMLPGIDHRQFAGAGRGPAYARANERWKSWLELLLKNADAEMPEFADFGLSINLTRVA